MWRIRKSKLKERVEVQVNDEDFQLVKEPRAQERLVKFQDNVIEQRV